MAVSRKAKKKDDSASEIELRPDGWRQFERAVDAAVKGGPMHRAAPKPKAKRTTGKRRAKLVR